MDLNRFLEDGSLDEHGVDFEDVDEDWEDEIKEVEDYDQIVEARKKIEIKNQERMEEEVLDDTIEEEEIVTREMKELKLAGVKINRRKKFISPLPTSRVNGQRVAPAELSSLMENQNDDLSSVDRTSERRFNQNDDLSSVDRTSERRFNQNDDLSSVDRTSERLFNQNDELSSVDGTSYGESFGEFIRNENVFDFVYDFQNPPRYDRRDFDEDFYGDDIVHEYLEQTDPYDLSYGVTDGLSTNQVLHSKEATEDTTTQETFCQIPEEGTTMTKNMSSEETSDDVRNADTPPAAIEGIALNLNISSEETSDVRKADTASTPQQVDNIFLQPPAAEDSHRPPVMEGYLARTRIRGYAIFQKTGYGTGFLRKLLML